MFLIFKNYSSLNASIGFTCVALVAGIRPISVPKITNIINDINTIKMDTDGLTKTDSDPSPKA
jgi:hypothetical protein